MQLAKDFDVMIGIDPGVNTGFAVWNVHTQKLQELEQFKIHDALERVLFYISKGYRVKIRLEDARKRGGSHNIGKNIAKMQGAGSVKRDSKIWEDFCIAKNLPYDKVRPIDNATKLDADQFKRTYNWPHKTNEHTRDAAMLVIGF